MSAWVAIIVLLAIAGLLMVLELFLIPGTTLVGILSLVLWVIAIGWAFVSLDAEIASWVLAGSLVGGASLIIYAMKSGTWKHFTLKSVHQSQVEGSGANIRSLLKVGDVGTARSALRPIGYASFHKQRIEVRTFGGYIDAGESICIAKLDGQQIFVQRSTASASQQAPPQTSSPAVPKA